MAIAIRSGNLFDITRPSEVHQQPSHALEYPLRPVGAMQHTAAIPSSSLAASSSTASSFFGREREMTALDRLFDAGGEHLVTIFGPGGIGKTRLALEWADWRETHNHYPDGVCLIDLRPISEPAQINAALAVSLGLALHAGQTDQRTTEMQVNDFLRRKQMLLIFDNFEHLLPCAGLLDRLLQAAPQIHLLVTSRQRLNLRQESVISLTGLTAPADGESIEAAPAVRLFLHVAQRQHRGYAPASADLAVLARLCRRVEGLPLAIELAAAWVDTLPPAEIDAEIGKGLDLLAAGAAGVAPYHHSMRAVFDTSWQILDEQERCVLVQLAVFPAPFSAEALQAIVQAQDGAPPQPLLLAHLIRSSLLRFDPTLGRYSIHELLRQYLSEHLSAIADCDAVHERYATHYASVIEAATAQIKAGQWDGGLDRIEADSAHASHAWAWHVQRRVCNRLAQMVDGVAIYFDQRGRFADGFRTLQLLIDALADTHEPDDLCTLLLVRASAWQALFEPLPEQETRTLTAAEQLLAKVSEQGGAPAALALLRLCQGKLHQRAGAFSAADVLLEALALFREMHDEWGIVQASYHLGIALDFSGQREGAEQVLEEARLLSLQRNSTTEEAQITFALVSVLESLGEFARAQQIAETVLTKLPDSSNAGAPINRMQLEVRLALCADDYLQAVDILQQHADLMAYQGNERERGVDLVMMAMLSLRGGAYDRTLPLIEEGVAILRRLEPDQSGFVIFATQVRAIYELVCGNLERADRLEAEVVEQYRRSGNIDSAGGALVYRSLHARRLGRPQEAKGCLLESISLIARSFDVLAITEWLLAACLLLIDDGEVERAAGLYDLAQQGACIRSALYQDLAGKEIEAALATLPDETRRLIKPRMAGLTLRTVAPLLHLEFAARWEAAVLKASATAAHQKQIWKMG
ncbi:MAG: AAA family ATPase [Caldilinea sp.]